MLHDNGEIRRRFKELIRENISIVTSWDHERISPQTQRMYSRRKPANEAAREYVRGSKATLDEQGIQYILSTSSDVQRPEGSRAEFIAAADPDLICALNTKVRESRELLFFPGALVR